MTDLCKFSNTGNKKWKSGFNLKNDILQLQLQFPKLDSSLSMIFFLPCLGHGFVCVYVCVYVCETDLDRPMTHQNRKRESKVVQQLHCPQSIWCLQWTQVLSTAEVTATYTHTHPQIYTNTHTYTHRASECRSTARPQAKSHCTGT